MKDCFGTIYPDFSQLRFGKEIAGKVFRVKIDTLGPGNRDRRFELDGNAWQECQACNLYRSSFDLSNARLAMQQAISRI